MTATGFTSVGHSAKRLFGPRKILVCGYTPDQQNTLCGALKKLPECDTLPMIFARPDDLETTLENIFAREDNQMQQTAAPGPAVIIMAGLMEHELHLIMAEHKKTPLASPIWATLTPTSATWKLGDLFQELGREKEALHKRITQEK